MSVRLTTAIRISDSANAILQRVKVFDYEGLGTNEEWDARAHVGIEPMLLALSMELALKAWFVFDHDTLEVIKSHCLPKLFAGLKSESQHKLDSRFRESVAPLHPNFINIDYGIKTILEMHANAFVDWRYVYEAKSMSFESAAFIATLEMVLEEFKKRYRVEKVAPI